MKINIEKQEDKVLLSEYLLSLGYECTISGDNLSADLPEELALEIESMTEEELNNLQFAKDRVAKEDLESYLKVEDEKIKLERIIANLSLPESVRDAAQVKLDELNGGE